MQFIFVEHRSFPQRLPFDQVNIIQFSVEFKVANEKEAITKIKDLKSALDCLNSAIEHSKHGHVDLAKKSAEDAIVHLKAVK
jgi:hypothetical protein